MADDDGLILNFSLSEPSAPKPVSRTSLKKQYVIEGGSKFERQMIRKAIRNQKDKERGIEVDEGEPKDHGSNDTPLGKKRPFNNRSSKDNDTVGKASKSEKKVDTSLAAQFRKKRKVGESNGKASHSNGETKKPTKVVYKEKREGEDGNTFVSSLFRSDDVRQSQESASSIEEEEDQVNEPSNAPLKNSDLSFEGLGVGNSLVHILLDKMGLLKPTRIQRAVIPRAVSKKDNDLFVQAQTGSGKTLAYTLPILQRLIEQSADSQGKPNNKIDRSSGVFGVILAPTRELAAQIYSVLEKLQRGCHWIVPGIVSGGEKKKSEKARIRKGVNILVATPGRFADHIDSTESLDLSSVRWLVLDECDRLMELGFEETITKILKALDERSNISKTKNDLPKLPSRRVNILCSATVKGKVKELGETSLKNADWVTADSVSGTEADASGNGSGVIDNPECYAAPAQLIQKSTVVPAKLRLVTLAGTLKNTVRRRVNQVSSSDENISRVIVFFSCSDSVDFHFSAFTRGSDPKGEKTGEDADNSTSKTVSISPWLGDNTVVHKLHGSLNQATRTSTLAAFFGNSGKNHNAKSTGKKKVFILFCTDVASRGLDLPHITDVIEYDPPFATEDHIHRVGRTARAGKEGTSTIFLLPGNEEKYLDEIKQYHPSGIRNEKYESILRSAFAEDWDQVNNHSKASTGLDWEVEATTWHLNVERWLLADGAALSKAKRAFTSHVRAYATHLASQRSIFNLKELHLGHLAKSFGLRETPGKMAGSSSKRGDKGKKRRGKSKGYDDSDEEAAPQADGRKQLLAAARKLGRSQAAASEFNFG